MCRYSLCLCTCFSLYSVYVQCESFAKLTCYLPPCAERAGRHRGLADAPQPTKRRGGDGAPRARGGADGVRVLEEAALLPHLRGDVHRVGERLVVGRSSGPGTSKGGASRAGPHGPREQVCFCLFFLHNFSLYSVYVQCESFALTLTFRLLLTCSQSVFPQGPAPASSLPQDVFHAPGPPTQRDTTQGPCCSSQRNLAQVRRSASPSRAVPPSG